MITLTFCRLFPKAMGDRVRAIALVQTTYTNPVRTTNMAGLLTALERPVVVPLLHLTIWLSPLIWLSNLMSYLNGSALLSSKSSGFAGTETLEELDFVAAFNCKPRQASWHEVCWECFATMQLLFSKALTCQRLSWPGIEIRSASQKQANACTGIFQTRY